MVRPLSQIEYGLIFSKGRTAATMKVPKKSDGVSGQYLMIFLDSFSFQQVLLSSICVYIYIYIYISVILYRFLLNSS